MNKVELKLTGIICLICLITSSISAQVPGPNLIVNPSFEEGPVPTWSRWSHNVFTGYVDDWGPGYLITSYNPTKYEGTADVYDYSPTADCSLDYPPNDQNHIGQNEHYPTDGHRYVFFAGGFIDDPYGTGHPFEGESVMGKFTHALCPGTYTLSFDAVSPHTWGNCTGSGNVEVYYSENKVEVVLRKFGDPSAELLIYTTPINLTTNSTWHSFSDPITLTGAQLAAGYDRIEFRMKQTPYHNLRHAAFLDNTSLTLIEEAEFYDVHPPAYNILCSYPVDLDNTDFGEDVSCPAGTISSPWFDESTQSDVIGSVVQPGVNTRYTKRCVNANGCLVKLVTIDIIVGANIQTETIIVDICEPTMILPPADKCPQVGVQSWSWTINNQPPFSSADPNGAVLLSPGDQAIVTTHYQNGCECTTIINAVAPALSITVHPKLVCYGDLVNLDAFSPPIDPDYTIMWDGQVSSDLSRQLIVQGSFTTVAELYNEYGCLLDRKIFDVTLANQTVMNAAIKLCPGESYDLDFLTDVTFILEPMTGVSITGSSSATITPPPGGQVYTLYSKNPDGTCYQSQLDISYYPDPIVEPVIIDQVCSGDCIDITAICPAEHTTHFTWDDASTDATRTVCPEDPAAIYEYKCYAGTCLLKTQQFAITVLPNNKIDHGLDPIAILLCEDEEFSPTKCPINTGATVKWYDQNGNEVPSSNGNLIDPGFYPTNPTHYTKVVSGPGECDECKESYLVQGSHDEGVSHPKGTPWTGSPLREFDPAHTGNEYGGGYVYNNCHGCIIFDFDNHHNTAFDFPENCVWKRRAKESLESTSDDVYRTDPLAMQGFEIIPKSPDHPFGAIKICFDLLSDDPLFIGGNETMEFCFFCEGTSGDCFADGFCFQFRFQRVECKKGGDGITSIDDMPFNEPLAKIYPNPNNGVFTLELSGYNLANSSFTIVDAIGREIMRTQNIVSAKSVIDLSKYEKGIYFISIQEGEAITTKKIIIQ